jgi:type IV secretory pathway TraG/TraD family ATPase VirD4
MGKFRDWIRQADDEGTRSAFEAPEHPADRFARDPNSWSALLRRKRALGRDNCMWVGASDFDMIFTEPDTNLLVIGPSRSRIGKTASAIIVALLTSLAPAVVTSIKTDAARATGLVRSALGRCWQYSPNGDELISGMYELRWSPIVGAENWDMAVHMSHAWMSASLPEAARNGENSYFTYQAEQLLSSLLFAAATYGMTMRWLCSAVWAMKVSELGPLTARLYQDGHTTPADQLFGVLQLSADRTRPAVFSQLGSALTCYRSYSVMESTDSPNFSPFDFVDGDDEPNPDLLTFGDNMEMANMGIYPRGAHGHHDTAYLIAQDPSTIGPLMVCFLSAVRYAASKRRAERDHRGQKQPPAVQFLLDELANIAGLPDLYQQLAVGGEGVVTMAIFQDYSQAQILYGTAEAEGLLTLFQQIAIYPGCMNPTLLEALSKVSGQYRESVFTTGQTTDYQGHVSRSVTEQSEMRPRLPVDVIANGHPSSTDLFLYFGSGGVKSHWLYGTPYWRAKPWPQLLVRMGEALATYEHDEHRRGFRMPNLTSPQSRAVLGEEMTETYLRTQAALEVEATELAMEMDMLQITDGGND